MKAIHVSNGTGLLCEVLGMSTTTKVSSRETGGLYYLAEQAAAPGQGVPLHCHSREDEVFFVIEGCYRFLVGEQSITAGSGDILHAPRGVPHGYRALGPGICRLRYMVMPGELEKFFNELALFPEGPPDLERLEALCGRFGIELLAEES